MPIFLYNTLTHKKEEFLPITPSTAGIYSCGPTVYDRIHIGNLRAFVFPDILRRVLELNEYKVNFVRNITDVDDKTIARSQKENIPLCELTQKYEEMYLADVAQLNIKEPTTSPRATEHVAHMISLIETLLEKEIAYKTSDGIYFSISKSKDYGQLAGLHIDTQSLQERIANDEYDKENPQDFAVWKFWTEKDGDVVWDASFGKGRPGWHIECSAMSGEYLGNSFDIHTGGIDLIFPHHTNEIAQSEAVHGVKFVNYWLHNGHILVDGKKMSKSLGNFYTLENIIGNGISPLAFRYWLLTANYQTQVNFTWEALKASQTALRRLVETIAGFTFESEFKKGTIDENYKQKFISFVNDDLDTPKAIALVWELLKDKTLSDGDKKETIFYFDQIFGLDIKKSVEDYLFAVQSTKDIPKEVVELADERAQARASKDFSKSDELRDSIKHLGYEIKDDANNTYSITKLK